MTREEQIRNAARYKYKDERIHFIDGAKWADQHPNWISVEDELPQNNGGFSDEVLVYGGTGFSVAQYNYISNCWFGTEYTDDEITHWMLLPQPPRKEE